jgi:DNA helicase II / ATP-dependent DNA helicase PcrA
LLSSAPISRPPEGHEAAVGLDTPGLEDDEPGALVVREELRLLAVVKDALLEVHAGRVEDAYAPRLDDARLLELRDEVAAAKPEDLPALFDQMHTLGAIRAQRGKGATGHVDLASPYFGHLRLEEGGRRRDVLIGARSYVDGAAGVRIVDWRNAPVSRIYYRYHEGDEYEEEFGDRIVEGRVLAKRSVAIVQGALVRVSSSIGAFARSSPAGPWRRIEASRARLSSPRRWSDTVPGALAEKPRLGVGADGQTRQDKLLPAIAAMLDKAQFELIARPTTGLVAIQGSAGSGKTTVGLHRVAYLAFADPQRFRPERMLVVVPHDALVHYVGRVLPTLGVLGVPVVTFARYAAGLLAALLPKLPSVFTEDTPPVVSRAKAHPAMLRAMERAAARVTSKLDAMVHEQLARWPQGEDVVAAWHATAGSASLQMSGQGGRRGPMRAPNERVTLLARWFGGKTRLPGAPSAEGLPAVTRSALERLGHDMRRLSGDVLGAFDELLTNRKGLAETFEGEPVLGPGQLDLVHDWCVRRARLRSDGERDGETAALDTEDVAILLCLWQVLRGPLVDDDGRAILYSHMFIDEVQDASPVELKVLLGMVDSDSSLRPSVTLAGDLAQRTFAQGEDRGEFDWKSTLAVLGLDSALDGNANDDGGDASIEALRVSYRSTAEITTFARGVLGPLAHEAEPIATRHGPPVELFTFASVGESVAWLADALKQLASEDPDANVALVSRFAPHADAYFEGLMRAEVPRLRRVARQDFTWEPGVDVTDVRQTKGLEFDEVVLLETTAPSYPDNAPARHALYVGATRAAHQLWCVSSEAPSPIVTQAIDGSPTG